jgi:hypothetical protein
MTQQQNKTVVAPGTETCGCCEGIDTSTPRGLANRMGLSAIAYRIGEYAQFKESMLSGLSSSKYPGLAGLRTREADDFTLGLIDAVACAADVLTFYQERVANESYLRTATERVSLQEMARLIGYRLRPGVAAETLLAFALEAPKTPPSGLPPEPGSFVTGIPTSLILARGLKVQSVPGPDEKPQTFETVEAIAARPEWNAIRPWLSAPHAPGLGATETWVKGVANNLKVGDVLVFSHPDFLTYPTTNTNWDFRLIDTVEVETAADRTHVSWKAGLARASTQVDPPIAPQVHVLRKRAAVFGHNAPLWKSMNETFRKDYSGKSDENLPDRWPGFTITSATGAHVDLDAVFSEIKPGGLAVLTRVGRDVPADAGQTRRRARLQSDFAEEITAAAISLKTFTELYKISTTTEVSLAAFALSGKVTRIGVQGQNLNKDFRKFVRETSVYAQSEPLTLAPYPVTDPVGGDTLPLAVCADGLLAGRTLIVTGTRIDDGSKLIHQAALVDAQSNPNGAVLTITPPLPASLERDTVVVHANVANATHGETSAQVLGAGDASQSFQRFELKRLPLTYRSAPNETGADSELTVRVGDIEWTEKPTLFGSTPAERAYTLATDEQGKTWVVFGDGVQGARLPSGVNNVRASYRQGVGQNGNVGADTLSQLMTRPLGLKSVSNPMAAQGGTDPEPADQIRRTMPLGTRTIGRAVSLLDYEDFAMAFTGIAKAQAQVLQLPAGPTIAITLAGQEGVALSSANPVWNNLWLALKAGGDPHVNVALLAYQASTFRLGLKVKRDAAYDIKPLLAAVEAALRAHYSFDARSLAQPVLQSDVIAVAHSVSGVVAVDIDFLHGAQTVQSRQTRLLASRMRVSSGVARPSELLTLHPGPFDRLEEMT